MMFDLPLAAAAKNGTFIFVLCVFGIFAFSGGNPATQLFSGEVLVLSVPLLFIPCGFSVFGSSS